MTTKRVTWHPTAGGARVLHAGHVVSEVRARPGPTHSLFDVLAAAVVTLSPGPRLAVLGFGSGSLVAPLRALGWSSEIEAVDRSRDMVRVYRTVVGNRMDPVRVDIADAGAWLRRGQRELDAIVEDLSVPVPGDVVMPPVCFDPLPRLMARRLAPGGVAIVNAFSPGPAGWARLLARLVAPGTRPLEIHLDDFDHRILLLGGDLPSPRRVGRRMRAVLRDLRSRQSDRVHVRGPRWAIGGRDGEATTVRRTE